MAKLSVLKLGQKLLPFRSDGCLKLSKNWPLGGFFHRVAMSVLLSVPFSCNFFEASHWPSGHMIRLSFTMASVPAVLHDGISTLKMKIYIKKCTSLRLVIFPPLAVLQDGISTRCPSQWHQYSVNENIHQTRPGDLVMPDPIG